MSANLTPWFPSKIKPEHEGVYETKQYDADSNIGYQYWNGYTWRFYGYDVDDAFRCRGQKSGWQSPQWRGLAEKP